MLWEQLLAALNSWMGTPYRHLWMRKGRGVDCSLLLGAVLQELGIIRSVKHGNYPQDWYLHRGGNEHVLNGFKEHIASEMCAGYTIIDVAASAVAMRGDMLSFCTIKQTGESNHAGILMEPTDTFVHSIFQRGVSRMQYGRWWKERITHIYRIMADN